MFSAIRQEPRRLSRPVALLGAFALVLGACGSGATDDPATDEDPAGTVDEDGDADDAPAASDEEDRRGGTLRIAYPTDPVTLDHMATTATPQPPRRAVFEQLYGPDAQLNPSPVLATGHEVSDDGLTWTIGLREGVLFHNGEEMTSEDVVASFDRYREIGSRAWELEAVTEVVAVDDYTIDIELSEPFGSLLASMAAISGAWAIIPASTVEEIGLDGEMGPELFIGTGPYEYVEHTPDVSWVFNRFEDYWGGPDGEPSMMAGARHAYFDEVIVSTIEDDATRVVALEGGEVDVIDEVPPDSAARLDENPDFNITVQEPGWRIYFKFNPRRPPFDDAVLREAVRTGIEPGTLLSSIGPAEFWRVNCTPRYQEGQWPWMDQCHTYPGDIERARELVEESDYDGEEITFLVTPGRAEFPVVIPLQAYLTDIGLNVNIVSVDGATFGELRANPDEWQLKASGAESFSGLTYLDSSAADRTGEEWPNLHPEFHEVLDAAVRAETEEERLEHLERYYEIHAEDNNELWLGDAFLLGGSAADIRGVPTVNFGLDFVNMWRED